MRIEISSEKFINIVIASEKAVERTRQEFKDAQETLKRRIEEYKKLSWFKQAITTDPEGDFWSLYSEECRIHYAKKLNKTIVNAKKYGSIIVLTDDELNFLFNEE